MRIAIISDIHANLPALEETLKSIEENDIDAIYCLGDLVGYNIWPNAVISEIRKRRIPTIAGNHDVKAVRVCNEPKTNDDENFAYYITGKEQVKYLSTLPAHIRLEFQLNGQPFVIMMVHGSPYSNKEYLLEDKEESEFTDIFLDRKIDVLVFGHSHKPYHRIIYNNKTGNKYFHAINAGSVGKPKDGNPKCCYVIISLNKKSINYTKDFVKVDFVRVPYDIEKAAKAIEGSNLPESYADMLRKGY